MRRQFKSLSFPKRRLYRLIRDLGEPGTTQETSLMLFSARSETVRADDEVKDLMDRNLLRVMDEVDAVSERLREKLPSVEMHSARKDLPARWGGLGDAYFPHEERTEQKKLLQHDEL